MRSSFRRLAGAGRERLCFAVRGFVSGRPLRRPCDCTDSARALQGASATLASHRSGSRQHQQPPAEDGAGRQVYPGCPSEHLLPSSVRLQPQPMVPGDQGPLSSASSTTHSTCSLSDNSDLPGVRWYPTGVWICIVLVAVGTEHLFMCLLARGRSSPEKSRRT